MAPCRIRLRSPGFCAIALVFALLSVLLYNSVEEDAYIYFRLAENLADGHGYVFNPGGHRVEAGSSPLWLALLVPLTLLPIPLVTSAKLMGIGWGIACLYATFRLSRCFIADPLARLAPCLLLALSVPFLFWSQQGLETPLYTFVVLFCVLALVEPSLQRFWYVPFGVLFLARPEGLLEAAIVVPFLIVRRRRWRKLAGPLAGLVVFALGIGIARLAYFHDLVPQPFYTKMFATSLGLAAGQGHAYLAASGLYWIALPIGAAALLYRSWSAERVILLFGIALLAAWSYTAVDGLKWFGRHSVPLLPLVYVASVSGLESLASLSPRRRSGLLRGTSAALVLWLALVPQVPRWGDEQVRNPVHAAVDRLLDDPTGYLAAVGTKMATPEKWTALDRDPVLPGPIGTNYQALVGRFVHANYPPGTLLAYDQMGQTPYYAGSDRTFIDIWGLTDKRIGYYLMTQRSRDQTVLRAYRDAFFGLSSTLFPGQAGPDDWAAVRRYLQAADPEVFLFNRFILETPKLLGWSVNRWSVPFRLRSDPEFWARYAPRALLAGWVFVYERRDLPRREFIVPEGLGVKLLGGS